MGKEAERCGDQVGSGMRHSAYWKQKAEDCNSLQVAMAREV